MNVSLTPELERLVDSKVRSGSYASASEVVREALRLLGRRDARETAKLEALRGKIDEASAEVDRGEAVEGSAAVAQALAEFHRLTGRHEP